MKKYRFPVIIEQDEDSNYIALVPALKGCHTQARTLDELMKRVKEAIELCVEVEKKDISSITSTNFIGFQEVEVAV